MIKIIQISASYKPAYIYGGPIMSVSMLCEALQNYTKSADVEVLTTTANGKDELQVEANQISFVDGVKVTYYPRLTKDHTHFAPALLKQLTKKINQFLTLSKEDDAQKITNLVIHIHAWWNLISIFSCLIAKWKGIIVVLSPRGMLTNYTLANRNASLKSMIHFFLGKELLKYCHIHATSDQERDEILQWIRPKSITVIPNLVQLSDADSVTDDNIESENATFKMVFLSRIHEKKGLEVLFDALAMLTIPWSLTIAGAGEALYVNGLIEKTKSLYISDRITWLGHVHHEQKFELLAKHDLLVLTSQNENFANVVIESLSVGTPVLLSDAVGLASYVDQNKFGWTTNLEPANIMNAINESATDQTKRKWVRKMAPQLIRNDFNDKVLINRYLSLYETVTKS